MKSAASPNMCQSCGAELTPLQAFQGDVCERLACRGPVLQQLHYQAREKRRLRRLEIGKQALGILGHDSAVEATVAVVPHCDWKLGVTPPELVQEFRESLRRAIENAADGWTPAEDSSVPAVEQVEQLELTSGPSGIDACATCRGSCCTAGGSHAYLDSPAIRSYWSRHPILTADEILRDYLQKLPGASIEGSCVYHGMQGCHLSQEMRGKTCNDFRCEGLSDYLVQLVDLKVSIRFVAAADVEEVIVRIAEVAADGERTVRYHRSQE